MAPTIFLHLFYTLIVVTSDALTAKKIQRVRTGVEDTNKKAVERVSGVFENEVGGNVKFPRGFHCLTVILFSDETLGCRYKKNGVTQSNKLDVDQDSFECKIGQSAFIANGTLKDGKVKIPPFAKITCIETPTSQNQYSIYDSASRIASRTSLILRVTSNGVAPSDTASQLSDYIFGTSGTTPNAASIFRGCSYDQVILSPATGSNHISNGVVEVSITPPSTEFLDMANSAKLQAQNKGINTDSYSHVLFALPSTMTDGGVIPKWSAQADTPGTESYYTDGEMRYTSVTVHEIGHNLGLYHSNEGGKEYGDDTCTMGGDTHEGPYFCFNAAKMKQLGWYTSRETFINPLTTSFSGKLIGVNDYGDSTKEHTLVLEVNRATSGNLFLFYNIAEGITRDTGEYAGEIIVNEVLPSRKSDIIHHIAVGSSRTVSNVIGSRDLSISFDSIGSDGKVNYALVTVKLADETCSTDSNCNDSISCTQDSCSNSICLFQLQSDCCGNGSCDFISAGETCGSCSSDCSTSANDCGVLDATANSVEHYDSPNTWGSLFNIVAKADISVHSITFFLIASAQTAITNNVAIYSKDSTWFSANDSTLTSTSGWTQVFSGSAKSTIVDTFDGGVKEHMFAIELNSVVGVSSGNLQAFYVQVTTNANEYYTFTEEGTKWDDGTVQIDGTDMILYEGAHCDTNSCYDFTVKFRGKIGYMYQKPPPNNSPTPSPISPPTPSPVSPISPPTPSPVSPPTPSPISPPTPSPISPPTPSPISPPTPSTATLKAISNGSNKIFGNMFYITSKLDMSVLQFMIRSEKKTATFKIYTKPGKELNRSVKKWDFIHKKKTTGMGLGIDTDLGAFTCGIDISSGKNQAFYIKTNKKLVFSTKESQPADIAASDSYMTIMHGIALKTKKKTSNKFVWNGAVTYLTGLSGSCS